MLERWRWRSSSSSKTPLHLRVQILVITIRTSDSVGEIRSKEDGCKMSAEQLGRRLLDEVEAGSLDEVSWLRVPLHLQSLSLCPVFLDIPPNTP